MPCQLVAPVPVRPCPRGPTGRGGVGRGGVGMPACRPVQVRRRGRPAGVGEGGATSAERRHAGTTACKRQRLSPFRPSGPRPASRASRFRRLPGGRAADAGGRQQPCHAPRSVVTPSVASVTPSPCPSPSTPSVHSHSPLSPKRPGALAARRRQARPGATSSCGAARRCPAEGTEPFCARRFLAECPPPRAPPAPCRGSQMGCSTASRKGFSAGRERERESGSVLAR